MLDRMPEACRVDSDAVRFLVPSESEDMRAVRSDLLGGIELLAKLGVEVRVAIPDAVLSSLGPRDVGSAVLADGPALLPSFSETLFFVLAELHFYRRGLELRLERARCIDERVKLARKIDYVGQIERTLRSARDRVAWCREQACP